MSTDLEGGNLCLQEEVQYVASIGTCKAGVQCNGSKRLTLQQRYQKVMSRADHAWLGVPVSLPMLHYLPDSRAVRSPASDPRPSA